jgi:hypothetical protein
LHRYTSSSTGSGGTLSPLSAPAAATPEATAALQPPQDAQPEARSPASAPPAQPQASVDANGEGETDADAALDAQIDAAIAEHADGDKPPAQAEPEAPVDLTVDERANFFKDSRVNEIPPASTTDYGSVVRLPPGVKPTEGFDSAMRAAVKSGVGITSMQGFYQAFMDTARNGPIRTSEAAATAALQAEWGDKTEANVATAKAFIGQLEKTWPTVKAFLNSGGLGNDPVFIKQIVAHAKRRGL